MLSLCIGCESTSDAESHSGLEAWLFREVKKDSDWISCYTEEGKKVSGATARCCALADKRFWALVRGMNLEVLVLGQDFGWKDTDTAARTRRRRRPRPPSVVHDPQPECNRALCVSPLGVHLFPANDLQPLPDLPPPERSGVAGATTTNVGTTSEGARTPTEDFIIWARELMRTHGTTAGAAMCCGNAGVEDIKELVKVHLAGEGRVTKLASLETTLRDHRLLYTKEQYQKWGGEAREGTRVRAGRNAECTEDRLELHCKLFTGNPLWSIISPSGEAPAPPEVLPDAMVLEAASTAKLTLHIGEEQLSEAEDLGIGTEHVDVGDDWESWPATKKGFVAGIGRLHIIDTQVELLRRLGAAARLQEPGSDPRLATAEQVKRWRDVLAPERVDLTVEESEGDQHRTPTRPSPHSARASPGEGELSDLADRTARATIHSSTELPNLSSTNSDFTTFASGLLAQTAALFNASSAHRPLPPAHPPSMWRKITQALLASAGATHASSDISRLVGGPIPGARSRTQLAALPGMRDSLLTGRPAPVSDSVLTYEQRREEEADAAAAGKPSNCNPVCYQCTTDCIEEARRREGAGMDHVFTAQEWRDNQVHMNRIDAVTCTLAQHGSGSASLYCGPAVGVATVCVLCQHPVFLQGLPSPVCSNCGVSYIEPIKGTYEPKNLKSPLGISRKELIAGTMAAMVGGGGNWVQREKKPDKMQELLCRAWSNPRDDMVRYSRLAIMAYCGPLLRCGLHPEFQTELTDKSGLQPGRYTAPFTSIPHMDGLCLHARLFQSTSDRMKAFKVPTKDGGLPSPADLKAAALKELKSIPDWPWRKDPLFQYESGVTLLLGATRNYFDFLVNLFGEGLRADFEETYATLTTMLHSPSFGRKLSKAEFFCNVSVAEWAHRMHHHFDPESGLGNMLYAHEIRAGSSVRECFCRAVCAQSLSWPSTRQ
jgi:hypothetical protein